MSGRPASLLRAAALLAALSAVSVRPAYAFPLRDLALDDKARPFALKTAAGAPWSSAALAGKTVVVCYYRRGQAYSQSALAALAQAAGSFAGKGVVFLAVRSAEDAGEPLAGETSSALTFLADPERGLYGAWGLFILPTTVVLDKDLRLRAAFASDQGDLGEKVAAAVGDVLGLARPPEERKADGPPADAPPASVGLARELLAAGKAQEALALLEPLPPGPEGGCELRLTAARAYLALKRPVPAKAQAEACLAQEASSAGAALALGRAAAALGDERGAEEWLRKAAALDAGSAEAQYHLGGVYERTGRKDEALAAYRAALERLLRD